MTIKTFIIVIFFLLFADCCNCGNVSKEGVDNPEGLQTKAEHLSFQKPVKNFYQYIKPDYEKVTKIVAQER